MLWLALLLSVESSGSALSSGGVRLRNLEFDYMLGRGLSHLPSSVSFPAELLAMEGGLLTLSDLSHLRRADDVFTQDTVSKVPGTNIASISTTLGATLGLRNLTLTGFDVYVQGRKQTGTYLVSDLTFKFGWTVNRMGEFMCSFYFTEFKIDKCKKVTLFTTDPVPVNAEMNFTRNARKHLIPALNSQFRQREFLRQTLVSYVGNLCQKATFLYKYFTDL